MKKAVILVIVVGALMGLYFASQRTTDIEVPEDTGGVETSFRPNPSNATFTFDDGTITLSQGKNVREVSADSALVEETVLTEFISYGDLNDDSRDDAVVLLSRQGGGSGMFIYIAGFVSATGAYKGTNAIYVGDRVSPQSLTVSDGVVTLEYLDRDLEEPLAADPTLPTTKQFVFLSGELVER